MSMPPSLNANVRSIKATLLAAQAKLFTGDAPPLLRMCGFLRISCLAMIEPGQYSKLMKALFEQDGEWCESCTITATELITSSNPEINRILTPVFQLHRTQLNKIVVSYPLNLRRSA